MERTRKSENERFDQIVENHLLGDSYAILNKGATKDFDETMDREYPEEDRTNISALVCAGNGYMFWILNNTPTSEHDYFIMTESGKTFERL